LEVTTVHGDTDERFRDVSVRVAAFQTLVVTSATRVPKPVSVLELYDQILAGNAVITEAREELALVTTAFVLALTADVMPDVWVFVFAFTAVFPEAIPVASEVDAARIEALVFEFTLAVPAEIWEPIEVEAVVTSVSLASDPEVRVASVRFLVPYVQTSAAVMPRPTPLVSVLVPLFHTSAARVPKVVRDLAVLAQTAVGMVE
jgi:hypothetical protein